ncbi:MAG: hypothetical protein ACI4CX_09485 [Candidatus Weimeria sp.]
MGTVLRDKQGIDHTVFDRDSLIQVIREAVGDEIFDYAKEQFEDEADLSNQISDLEGELKGQKEYYENKLKRIEEDTRELADIIRQKNIDRKRMSNLAGRVSAEIHRRW